MCRNTNINIDPLLDKPVWQMTGREFCALTQYANAQGGQVSTTTQIVRVRGVRALAEYLDCCESTVNTLRRKGVLGEAVISHIGKNIVFDGEKARELAEKYQKERRTK